LDDTIYQNKLKCRWEYLRDRSFHQDSIFAFIDSMAFYLNDAQQRNFQKWPILGNYVWPNYYVGNTYQDELNFFKTWIGDRLIWIDNNLGGNCYEILGCTDPFACNYNPLANTNDGSCVFPVIWQQSFTICDGDNVFVGISIYDTTGNYIDTLAAQNGCDSTVYTNVIVSNNTSSYDTLVSNISINWNGLILTTSGDYSYSLINSVGCDSIANLSFIFNPVSAISDFNNDQKTLIKVVDVLGRTNSPYQNTTLFYIYNDGTVEKRVIIK
jgi:hypothetical protein